MQMRPTRMEISLDNCRYNYRAIRDHVSPSKVIAIVKADAYGLGAVPVTWALKTAGADFFAVATPDEAAELREAGIFAPVLVLGPSPYDAADTYVKLSIRATIADVRMAEALSRAAIRHNRPAAVHLKMDSGMGRLGFLPDILLSAAETVHKLPGIDLEGFFTHFSTADSDDLTHTRKQFEAFSAASSSLKKMGISVKYTHCCNSGALLAGLPDMHLDAVRPGHVLHGLVPSPECGRAFAVKPCIEVKTAVGVVRELPPDTGVSYGLTYTTRETERVAILPVGYADGLMRSLSGKGEVLIHGERCPIRGRVCMDQTVVGISHLSDVRVGDEAVVLGRQGDGFISVEEMAVTASSLPDAVSTAFSARVPKIYVQQCF